ncbi:MAG: hypothetical protein ACI39E_00240 [Acutalibacteraceae bacterium]
MKANQQIRQAAKEKGVFFWQIGKALGVTETTIVRRLREELPIVERNKVLQIINEIAAEGETVQ